MNESLDPRVNRLDDLHKVAGEGEANTHWATYEVFHQDKRGKQVVHVGIVHAPGPEMALVFAKEQYARRKFTSNLWVVKSSEVYTYAHEDEDIFETVPEKTFREPGFYKVRDRIEAYKNKITG
jgi:ring-1,2-phenylacetyl-CoA epoxidase subunit PaaB